MPKGVRGPVPPEKQCRATTPGMKVRGVYWSPPHRCGNYADDDGYCWQHQPADPQPDRPADHDPEGAAGRDEPV